MGIDVIREVIDGMVTHTITEVVRVGEGEVFLHPGSVEPFYIVVHVGDYWLCGCKGFRFASANKYCRHITGITDLLAKSVTAIRVTPESLLKTLKKSVAKTNAKKGGKSVTRKKAVRTAVRTGSNRRAGVRSSVPRVRRSVSRTRSK